MGKYLLLAALIAVLWYLWRRVNRSRMETVAGETRRTIQDVEKCPVCGTYVARGARGCGRGDCPRR